jgi:hypothetical protein
MSGILWFDCDGVLADFAGHFAAVYGHEPSGAREPLRGAFYDSLPLLPGAKRMVAETYGLRPFCLTHLPSEQGEAYLKRQWLDRHFPGLPVVEAERKAVYCRPGDCLVDDSERHREPWLKAGGMFLLHSDPVETLHKIRDWQGLVNPWRKFDDTKAAIVAEYASIAAAQRRNG